MTKNEYVNLRNNLENNAIEIIKQYALEKGMTEEIFEIGINHPILMAELINGLSNIIDYYDNMFEINLLINQKNQIIKIY